MSKWTTIYYYLVNKSKFVNRLETEKLKYLEIGQTLGVLRKDALIRGTRINV